MSQREAYEDVLKLLESDLANRRTQNDDIELSTEKTASIRGEIRYIKQLQNLIKERLLSPER
jgi:hypothetical protein